MDNKEISEFYDKFSGQQLKTGVNERLISLYKRLLKLGLSKKSNVLELGCGVGAFTSLLSKKVKKGKIGAVDLSPKSIESAKSALPEININFETADVVTYIPKLKNIDLVTLMDVIEHIPLEMHEELFSNISSYISEKTLLAINIPSPEYIDYVRKNNADKLQIIDQCVELPFIIKNLESAGLEMIYFEKYSIWEQDDYQFMVIRKKRDYQLIHISDKRNKTQKAIHKINKSIDQLRFK